MAGVGAVCVRPQAPGIGITGTANGESAILMARRSWKARQRRLCTAARKPVVSELLNTLLEESKIERKTQAAIMQDLIRKHHGDVPARVCWNLLADRRESARGAV